MQRNQNRISVARTVVLILVLTNAVVLQNGWTSHPKWYLLLYITVPLLLITAVVAHLHSRRRS